MYLSINRMASMVWSCSSIPTCMNHRLCMPAWRIGSLNAFFPYVHLSPTFGTYAAKPSRGGRHRPVCSQRLQDVAHPLPCPWWMAAMSCGVLGGIGDRLPWQWQRPVKHLGPASACRGTVRLWLPPYPAKRLKTLKGLTPYQHNLSMLAEKIRA